MQLGFAIMNDLANLDATVQRLSNIESAWLGIPEMSIEAVNDDDILAIESASYPPSLRLPSEEKARMLSLLVQIFF